MDARVYVCLLAHTYVYVYMCCVDVASGLGSVFGLL